MVKRPPAMQETRVQSLGWKDPLEKEMAIHSSTLAWKIPWMEEPNRLQSVGSQRVGHDRATSLSLLGVMTQMNIFTEQRQETGFENKHGDQRGNTGAVGIN